MTCEEWKMSGKQPLRLKRLFRSRGPPPVAVFLPKQAGLQAG